MRSIRLMAVSTIILASAWACGSGGTDVGTPPVAAFDQQCTGLACTFADHSTPANGISTWAWVFGDPTSTTNTADIQSPSHTFTAAGTYNVQLTVTDASGASNSKTNPVTVTSGNLLPTASFDAPACTSGVACAFHSTSTDADGQITATHWDFGFDEPSADGVDVTHTFNVTTATPFLVTLTVTDDQGGTATADQTITVAPPAAQVCTTNATLVNCSLDITQRSTVKFTLTGISCELLGNKVSVEQPRRQTAYFNVCSKPVGTEYTVTDATGAPAVFEAGAQLTVVFTQGVADVGDPAVGAPGAHLDGTFASWTVRIDDGGNPTGPGEPDFNDVVLAIQATPAP